MTGWILLIIIVLAIALFAKLYNDLIAARNQIHNALADIDTELTRRYDLIPNLVTIAKKYMAHEADTLTAVTAARSGAISAFSAVKNNPTAENLSSLNRENQQLNHTLAGLVATFEAYPELKADSQMQSLQQELSHTENRISLYRQSYNSSVTAYNNLAQQFPSNLIARFFQFQPSLWLQIDDIEQKRDAVKIDFS